MTLQEPPTASAAVDASEPLAHLPSAGKNDDQPISATFDKVLLDRMRRPPRFGDRPPLLPESHWPLLAPHGIGRAQSQMYSVDFVAGGTTRQEGGNWRPLLDSAGQPAQRPYQGEFAVGSIDANTKKPFLLPTSEFTAAATSPATPKAAACSGGASSSSVELPSDNSSGDSNKVGKLKVCRIASMQRMPRESRISSRNAKTTTSSTTTRIDLQMDHHQAAWRPHRDRFISLGIDATTSPDDEEGEIVVRSRRNGIGNQNLARVPRRGEFVSRNVTEVSSLLGNPLIGSVDRHLKSDSDGVAAIVNDTNDQSVGGDKGHRVVAGEQPTASLLTAGEAGSGKSSGWRSPIGDLAHGDDGDNLIQGRECDNDVPPTGDVLMTKCNSQQHQPSDGDLTHNAVSTPTVDGHTASDPDGVHRAERRHDERNDTGDEMDEDPSARFLDRSASQPNAEMVTFEEKNRRRHPIALLDSNNNGDDNDEDSASNVSRNDCRVGGYRRAGGRPAGLRRAETASLPQIHHRQHMPNNVLTKKSTNHIFMSPNLVRQASDDEDDNNNNRAAAAADSTTSAGTGVRGGSRWGPHVGRPYRVYFLDLDNTLIPTSWIMAQWKKQSTQLFRDPDKTLQVIREGLNASGLCECLDELFTRLHTDGGADRIVIVTNAGSRTVATFYLTCCMPGLSSVLRKHGVDLRSTEDWVRRLGPTPSPTEEIAFRDFYTDVKFREFQAELFKFLATANLNSTMNNDQHRQRCPSPSASTCDGASDSTTDDIEMNSSSGQAQLSASCSGRVNHCSCEVDELGPSGTGKGTDKPCGLCRPQTAKPDERARRRRRMEVVSVGDQICEISAACKLAREYKQHVSHAKLLMILDPTESRFAGQTPLAFVDQLRRLQVAILKLVDEDVGLTLSHVMPTEQHTAVASGDDHHDVVLQDIGSNGEDDKRGEQVDGEEDEEGRIGWHKVGTRKNTHCPNGNEGVNDDDDEDEDYRGDRRRGRRAFSEDSTSGSGTGDDFFEDGPSNEGDTAECLKGRQPVDNANEDDDRTTASSLTRGESSSSSSSSLCDTANDTAEHRHEGSVGKRKLKSSCRRRQPKSEGRDVAIWIKNSAHFMYSCGKGHHFPEDSPVVIPVAERLAPRLATKGSMVDRSTGGGDKDDGVATFGIVPLAGRQRLPMYGTLEQKMSSIVAEGLLNRNTGSTADNKV